MKASASLYFVGFQCAFPNIVELPVPPNGFGAKLDLIHEFHRERGLDIRRGSGHRRNDHDYVRWCFPGRADAEAFKAIFGGSLVISEI